MDKKQIGKKETSQRGEFKSPKRDVYVYFGSDENASFGAGVCEIPPGSSNERHSHPESDEVIYVIDGQMKIEVDGEYHVLDKADGILILRGQEHQIFNTSNENKLLHTFTFNNPGNADAIKKGYGQSDNFTVHPPEKSVEEV